MKRKTAAALMAFVLAGGIGAGAEDVYTLNPVVVTASRMETKEFDTQADISVVTRQQLEENHYTDLGDVIKDVPGVNLQNYGASGENYTSNRLYINGSPNIVVLVDGMRANVNGSVSSVLSPSEFANMNSVERVEVLKGSASTLYGSDAVGGVINIITKKPDPGVDTMLGFSAGSYAHRTWDFMNTGRENKTYWMAAAHKNDMGDFEDGHGNKVIHKVQSKTYSAMLGQELGEGSDITFRYTKYKSDYIRPSSGGLYTTTISKGKKDNEKYSLQWRQKISGALKSELSLYRNNNRLDDNINNPGSLWLMDLSTLGFTEQLTHETGRNTWIGGFDFYQDRVNNYSSTSYGRTDAYQGKHLSNRAWFLQDEFRFAKYWNITPGIRYTSTSEFGSNTSKSVVLGYNNGKINVYGAYKEFFVVPNQFQLYSKYGGKNLKPSDGHTVEAGINYDFGNNFFANFNIYRTSADNMIAFDNSTYKYANIASEKTRGWSLGLNKQFNRHWHASASYVHTHIPAESSKKNPNRDGYIPKGEVKLSIDYENNKFSAGLGAHGILDRPGRKVSESKRPDGLKSFWLFDLVMNFQPIDHMKIFFKVNNLTDKWYTDQLYLMDPESTNWYSAPGRNFQVGVEYRL